MRGIQLFFTEYYPDKQRETEQLAELSLPATRQPDRPSGLSGRWFYIQTGYMPEC